jgi:hypothetical protein
LIPTSGELQRDANQFFTHAVDLNSSGAGSRRDDCGFGRQRAVRQADSSGGAIDPHRRLSFDLVSMRNRSFEWFDAKASAEYGRSIGPRLRVRLYDPCLYPAPIGKAADAASGQPAFSIRRN